MSTKRSTLTILGALLVGASLLAQAPPPATTPTPTQKREVRMEKRADRQQKRIAQGVKSGQLTPKETAKLEKREAKINKDIAKAEADGKVTKKEAAKINREQNKASSEIHNKKHNAKHQ